ANTPVAPIPPPEVEQPTNGSSTATDSTTNNETQNPSDTVDKPVDSGGPTPTDPTTETPSTPPSSLSDTITGHYAEYSQLYTASYNDEEAVKRNPPLQLNIAPTGGTENLETLNLEGVLMDLRPPSGDDIEHKADGDVFIQTSYSDLQGVGGMLLDHTRYGVISKVLRDTSKEEYVATAFVQGKQTPLDAIPTTGTATYIGERIEYGFGHIETKTVRMDADFDNKVVRGDLDFRDHIYTNTNGQFTAKINGNTFATEEQIPDVELIDKSFYSLFDEEGNEVDPPRRVGEAEYEPLVRKVVVNGAFYGPNAEEVAGTFYGGYVGGAFGGKKVENGK
ncbi:transferrin-binding protein-like solute binding protein, partial [Glaesserella sp.]